jgi:uncharacterized protein YfiM (DUF2279 family)
LITLVLLVQRPVAAHAEAWWGADKAAHLGVSAGLGAAAYGLLWLADRDVRTVRFGLASMMATLPGLAKELHDSGQPGNHFSGADLFWDLTGALAGAGLVLGVDLLWARLGRRGGAAEVRLVPCGRGLALAGRF